MKTFIKWLVIIFIALLVIGLVFGDNSKEEPNNKKTGDNDNSTNLFILHPIFSVYFGISPRRKRKLDLTYNQAQTIFIEDEDTFKNLYDTYVKKLKLDTASENYSLLDYINEY